MGKARDFLPTSFMQPIAQGNIYRTGDAGISLLARQFPSLVYYTKLAYYILKASRNAIKGGYTDEVWVLSSKEVFNNLESVGVKIEVENLSVLSNLEGACVFVGNHMSTFEGFCYACIIRPFLPFTFVIKESLMKMPLLKHAFKSRNPILVHRDQWNRDIHQGVLPFVQSQSIVLLHGIPSHQIHGDIDDCFWTQHRNPKEFLDIDDSQSAKLHVEAKITGARTH